MSIFHRPHSLFSALIGMPVAHSLSPSMHNAAFAALGMHGLYAAYAVEPQNLQDAISGLLALGASGANLTVPHKEAAIRHCHSLSPAAQAIGAVNTLCFGDGKIYGHNTDAEGFRLSLLEELGEDLSDKKRVTILGAGGAARAVAHAMKMVHALAPQALDLVCIARNPAQVAWIQAEAWTPKVFASRLPQTDLLIDATSIGLREPQEEVAALALLSLADLPPNSIVGSLIYHRQTELGRLAEKRGLKTFDGFGMLVHQAALAFSLWFDCPAPVKVMAETMRLGLSETASP